LLHITEMSWTRINHPSDVVKVGDKIDVIVLRHDKEQNRISLGLKQILPDPWEQVRDTFKIGQMVSGTVTRVVPFGAFVRLESGIEGIIPNSELPGGRGQRAQDALTAGGTVEAKIMSIRPAERRMTLSLRQVQQAQERRELKEYMDREQGSGRVTIGDLVGNMFEAAAEADARAKEDEAGEEAPAGVDESRGEAPSGAEEPGRDEASESEGETAEPASAEWSPSESPAESEAESQ
jgi:4-hydroxy-3-methylbut-2-enyl diphosphate reductase